MAWEWVQCNLGVGGWLRIPGLWEKQETFSWQVCLKKKWHLFLIAGRVRLLKKSQWKWISAWEDVKVQDKWNLVSSSTVYYPNRSSTYCMYVHAKHPTLRIGVKALLLTWLWSDSIIHEKQRYNPVSYPSYTNWVRVSPFYQHHRLHVSFRTLYFSRKLF